MKLTVEKVGRDGYIIEYSLNMPMTIHGLNQKKLFTDEETMIAFLKKILKEDN